MFKFDDTISNKDISNYLTDKMDQVDLYIYGEKYLRHLRLSIKAFLFVITNILEKETPIDIINRVYGDEVEKTIGEVGIKKEYLANFNTMCKVYNLRAEDESDRIIQYLDLLYSGKKETGKIHVYS